MNRKYLYVVRVLVMAVPVASVFMRAKISMYTAIVVALLIYVLNMRMRDLYSRHRFAVLSLTGEIAAICLMQHYFGGMLQLLLLSVVFESIVYMKSYDYSLTAISTIAFLFLIRKGSAEHMMLNIFIFVIIGMFSYLVKMLSSRISEIEYLYDDVRRYSYELENAKKQVEMYSKRVEELAQAEERSRISSEIHDTIGHRLSALIIQLEAGIRLLDADGEKARELLHASRDSLRESLDVLRETVRNIRPKEKKSMILSIEDMVREFKRQTGINAVFKVEGNPLKLYPGVQITLYKNVQEALTNAARHGNAKNINITLTYDESSVRLEVKDDGTGCSSINKGMGLSGMEERLKILGGSLKVSGDNGFIVESFIPVNFYR